MPSLSNSARPELRAAIIGTGYIADFHARAIAKAPGVELVAVCDSNAALAAGFAAQWGVASYGSLDAMLAAERIDALHVLTPPDSHHAVSRQALNSGLHIFLEKPMCVSAAECTDLLEIADKAKLKIGVNHSLTFEGAFARLREHIRAGDLGPLDHITINCFIELAFIRFGPFTNWMLREPQNAMLEIGPHPISALLDLVGEPDNFDVIADRDVIIPGGARVYRRWRIRTSSGRTTADVNIDVGPGFQQRTIAVRGLAGSAFVDLDANTCMIDRRTPAGIDFDRRRRSLSQAAQLRDQSRETFRDYVLGKAKLGKRGGPFANSIQDSVAAFYAGLRGGHDLDSRIDGAFGKTVIETCERICASAGLQGGVERRAPAVARDLKPGVLVLGGTGFIGRKLIQQLLDKGHTVRAAARGASFQLEDLGSDRLEIKRGDMRSPSDIDTMLDGVDHVIHLATTDAKTWPQYLEREIEPTRYLARACLAHGVKRLVYTSTIDCYYAGPGAGTITERTPLDPKIGRRNTYARAKAAIEHLLFDMHRSEGLPLVVVRPGIVIGEGGNPFHFGVGRWASESVVETWGDGENPLPLVLVDDVAQGMVQAMETPGIEGRSFNLIDAPMLSARDYIAAVERIAGIRVAVHPASMWQLYLDDLAKWPVKRAVGHPDGARVPSYHDWQSRTQKAIFDCTATREELGWTPISDPEAMVERGVGGSLRSWLAARS